jgi:hypothetical protein
VAETDASARHAIYGPNQLCTLDSTTVEWGAVLYIEDTTCPSCLSVIRSHRTRCTAEAVDHPSHYGGADNPYEAIKVIEAWGLGFHLGNTVKYIAREGKKGAALDDLRKAAWYLNREIERRAKEAA